MTVPALLTIETANRMIRMDQILAHYGIIGKFHAVNNGFVGPCPLHNGRESDDFRVHVSRNVWNCFGECNHGGTVLDFIAIWENTTTEVALEKVNKWFNNVPSAANSPND